MGRRALFVSPHLGDVAFSVGATFAALSKAGWQTILLTVFTTGDAMAPRRAEDERAAEILGAAEVVHLEHAEARQRGYEDPFGEPHDEVDLDLPAADELFLPLGVGGHVDHLVVVRATDHLTARRYRELPAGLSEPDDAQGDAFAPSTRKLDACAAYVSQLEPRFGGEAAMRDALGGAQERVTRSAPGPSPGPGRAAPP